MSPESLPVGDRMPEIHHRLSFSDDLDQEDRLLLINDRESRRDSSLLDPNFDFEFRINGGSDQESSSADELFKNGKILPGRIRSNSTDVPRSRKPKQSLLPPRTDNILIRDIKGSDQPDESPPCTFWGFNRSSSARNSTKRSQIFSVASLYRSKSTGSALNPPVREYQKQRTSKQRHSTSSSPSSSTFLYSIAQQKPSWRKNCGEQGKGFWVSPILNVPTPCITKGTETLLNLGSRFRGRKEKKSKVKASC